MANPFFADPRRRTLAILGAIALLFVLLAFGALWQQSRERAGPPAPTEFLPGFAKQVRSAAAIHIASKAGAFDVAFVPEKGWVVPERNDYPAAFDLVQRTLVGLAALQTIEPRTGRADWLHFLGLDAPPLGDGTLIIVKDDKGKDLAAIVTGKSEDIGDPTGATGLFVRHPNENQSWLVRSVLDPRANISDWLDKHVVDVDRARIREADVDPAGSASYVVSRAAADVPDFTITPAPATKPSDSLAPDGVATALTEFGFDDVRPARELDFNDPKTAARIVVKTFDGLAVTVHVVKSGNEYWATISAEAIDPANHERAQEASAINAHAAGWAYKIQPFKGQLFMMTLDSLLKPPPAPRGMPAMGSP